MDLQRIADAVRRHRRLVALTVLVVTGLGILAAVISGDPYRATARIADAPEAGAAVDLPSVEQRLAIDRVLVRSPAVLAAAARRVPGETPRSLSGKVSTTIDPDARLLDVTAADAHAPRAARVANAVAGSLLAVRQEAERRAMAATRRHLTAQLDRLRRDPTAGGTVSALRARIARLVVSEASAGPGMLIVEPAQVPAGPAGRHVLRTAVLALAAGLLLALLAALVRDRRRPFLADAAELSRSTRLPLLAALPDGPAPRAAVRDRLGKLVRRRRRRSRPWTIEEAALGRAVRLAVPPRRQRVLLVCDQTDRAGAQRVAATLAGSLRAGGQPAMVIARPGQTQDGREGTLGRVPVLWARDLEAALDRVKGSEHRYVVVAATPETHADEVASIASRAAGAILVLRLGRASAADARAARRTIDALGVHGVGLVVTCAARAAARIDAADFGAAIAPSARAKQPARSNGGPAEVPGAVASVAERRTA